MRAPLYRRLRSLAMLAGAFLCAAAAFASEHHGQILFNSLPVPGATVTATHDGKSVSTVTNEQGFYTFADLADGTWNVVVRMTGFAAVEQQEVVAPDAAAAKIELKMLPLEAMMAEATAVAPAALPATPSAASGLANATGGSAAGSAKKPETAAANEAPKPPDEASAPASDGFLVNGSVNNAATSQYSLAQGFGNTRSGTKSLYTGGLAAMIDNSAFDARPFSFTGEDTPKPSYNRFTATATFGGPLKIPHVLPRGPNFFLVYQWTRDRTDTIDPGLVPTLAQRQGVLPSGTVPISPQAAALLALYPLPNIAGNAQYNYQTTVLDSQHQDALQLRMDKSLTRRDQVYGGLASQSIRADDSNLFGFRDATDTLGLNANINWNHRFNHNLFVNTGFRFSRQRTLVAPFFSHGQNVSGNAGISGNNQDPANFGPPTLQFSSGITGLGDRQSSFNRNRTDALSPSLQYYHGHHNVTLGGDFRRQEYNQLSQSDPRGSFTFTGAITGNDFGDFLAGKPAAATLAFGNADKYFRQSVYDAYIADDWRLRPELTLNVGLRYEYGAPMTELKNRLVNLDVAPGFSAVAPVLASAPIGPLTGRAYPNSLVQPDRTQFEPRLGVSWRPIPGSSVVMRAGYGIYADTSIYLRNASRMAVQPPLARSLSASYTNCPLTLATGLAQSQCDADTFGVDPNFRVGYAQTGQLAVQRDLPFALQMTATYLGVKGGNGVQQYLPNTYAAGAANPCASCPAGFYYRSTGGTSSRNAGSLQLRRRLRSGFTASAMYTFSKSIDDDAALGGQGASSGGDSTQSGGNSQPAQNWRDLHAERSLSTFDQRHLLTSSVQYTSGMGLAGGTLLGGWRGAAVKEWTVVAEINAGSGLPQNPFLYTQVPGTGYIGPLRPDRTSAPLYTRATDRFLNAAAFAAPAPGVFGNAGRNSITGPGTFTLNTSLARTFRVAKRYNLDIRVDTNNLLNHVVYTGYNTGLNPSGVNPLFGVPTSANAMRSLQTTARLRF